MIQVALLNPDGTVRALVGSTTVTLLGKNSAVVTADPNRVFADGIRTTTITVTSIRDLDGIPVPDGTRNPAWPQRTGWPNPAIRSPR